MDDLLEQQLPKHDFKIAGSLIVFVAGLIDGLLVIIFSAVVYILVRYNELGNLHFLFFVACFFFLYRFSWIYVFQCTLGMFIFGIKYLKDTDVKMSAKEKILAAFMIYINYVDIYLIK